MLSRPVLSGYSTPQAGGRACGITSLRPWSRYCHLLSPGRSGVWTETGPSEAVVGILGPRSKAGRRRPRDRRVLARLGMSQGSVIAPREAGQTGVLPRETDDLPPFLLSRDINPGVDHGPWPPSLIPLPARRARVRRAGRTLPSGLPRAGGSVC